MKKALFGAALIICIMLVTACQTSGNSAGQIDDARFRSVYDRYRSGLILDGAGTYTVRSGDTLVNISRSFYQDGLYYPIIMLASSDVVLDPDLINPGMRLTIPDLQVNFNNANARANIKAFFYDMADLEESRGRSPTANGIRQHANSL